MCFSDNTSLNCNCICVGVVELREKSVSDSLNAIAEWQGFFLELFGTMAVIFTYLATHNPNRNNRQSCYDFALSVGVVMFVVHLAMVSVAVVTCCHMLSHVVTCCHLSHVVTCHCTCHMLLHVVTCYMLSLVTCCTPCTPTCVVTCSGVL